MKTGEGADLFIRYHARTLDLETEAGLVRHMAQCPECSELSRAQAAVWSVLDEWKPSPVSSNFDERLYSRIAADAQRPGYRRIFDGNWNWKPVMPVGAACAALIAVLLLNTTAERGPDRALEPKVDIQRVEQALDDIDMLSQVSAAPTGSQQKLAPERM